MNTKWFMVVVLATFLFSCKRELSFIPAKEVQPPLSFVHSGADIGEPSIVENNSSTGLFGKQENRSEKKNIFLGKEKSFVKKKIAENNIFKKEVRKKIKEKKEIKKEMDPRLSRGLLMTIFGGIATTLGIVFMSYAPTGLFVFAFGVVFLVGLVTLIMYLANPKPKM